METISSMVGTYSVKTLDSFKEIELKDSEYLVRKIERNTGLDSKGVIIPAVTADSFVLALENGQVFEAALAWFEGVRGEVVKARMTAGRDLIVDADFSLEKVAEYLAEEEVKEGRISKDKIGKWFDAALADNLCAAFEAKLGTQFTAEVKKGVLEGYKKQFAKLSGKDLILETEVKGSMIKALSLATEESAIKKYCEAKIKEAKLPSSVLAML